MPHAPRPPVTHVTQPHAPPSTCHMCYTTTCTPVYLSHVLHNHMHPAHLSLMLHNHMYPRLLVTCVTQPNAPHTRVAQPPPTCHTCYTTTCTPVYLLHVLHNQMLPTHVLHNPRPPVTFVAQPHAPRPPVTCVAQPHALRPPPIMQELLVSGSGDTPNVKLENEVSFTVVTIKHQ